MEGLRMIPSICLERRGAAASSCLTSCRSAGAGVGISGIPRTETFQGAVEIPLHLRLAVADDGERYRLERVEGGE